MPLSPGSKLSVYEVTAKIGAGGMGEVYRAHDTTLDRDVAIKVLPDAFATDPERLARFEREAKVLASLNHPNIAAIYGLEKSGETPALVLELVEGPTLADLISPSPGLRPSSPPEGEGGKGKPLPLEEALPVARQIAEALEAAHEQGIIHRDLKPANVKVKSDGTVKVLDFGLAKALGPDLSDVEAANSPTMTMTAAATKMGVIMGTAAYMSPEQAKGRQVDKRADIWAFGVVLYEMLTGRQAFGGTDISETLASVLKTDLNLDTLPADTPRALRRVLSRCIQKDRSHRSRDIGDVRLDLDEALAAPGEEDETVEAAPVAQPVLWQRPIPALLAVVAVAAVSGLAVWSLMPRPDRPVTRFALTTPPDGPLALSGSQQDLAISPDGARVVYSSGSQDPRGRQLFIRDVSELEAVPVRGTEGGANPFFSPDGGWIGFRDARDGRLKKVSALGGPAVVICDCTANVMRGATWGPDDMVVFATVNSPGLMMVSAAGGAAEELTRSGQDGDLHIWPEYLPDGRAVLFTIWSGSEESAQVAVLSLETGAVDVLLSGGSNPHYVSTGHIVYGVGGTIRAVGFDVDRLELTSDNPIPVVENVGTKTSGVSNFGVSNDGSLVYIRGSAMGGTGVTPVWVDRRGQVEEIDGVPTGRYADLSLSPDGGWLAVARGTDQDAMDIWTLDLSRRTLTRVTTAPGIDQSPLWTPDGQRIVFASNRDGGGRAGLYSKAADGTGEV